MGPFTSSILFCFFNAWLVMKSGQYKSRSVRIIKIEYKDRIIYRAQARYYFLPLIYTWRDLYRYSIFDPKIVTGYLKHEHKTIEEANTLLEKYLAQFDVDKIVSKEIVTKS